MKDSQSREMHQLAMGLLDYSNMARRYGDLNVSRELLQRALHYETQAATIMDDQADDELWRTVLYRSAASLAMQCGEWDEAERLISDGLSVKPPFSIAEELRDLREQVRSLRRDAENAPTSQAKQPA